jgi:hypothetical protein
MNSGVHLVREGVKVNERSEAEASWSAMNSTRTISGLHRDLFVGRSRVVPRRVHRIQVAISPEPIRA